MKIEITRMCPARQVDVGSIIETEEGLSTVYRTVRDMNGVDLGVIPLGANRPSGNLDHIQLKPEDEVRVHGGEPEQLLLMTQLIQGEIRWTADPSARHDGAWSVFDFLDGVGGWEARIIGPPGDLYVDDGEPDSIGISDDVTTDVSGGEAAAE